MKTIYFAGGCFWGTEHYLSQFEGVLKTQVGYANGNFANPSYQQVYTDQTGFVECVQLKYNPEIISLETLCRMFFRSIDPLLKDRQGDDVGTRYRTGMYWTDEEDRAVINRVYDDIQSHHDTALAVEKCQLDCFYPGEDYHQDYLVKNPEGYCHLSLSTLQMAKTYAKITKTLRELSDDEKREVLPRFFKTGKGEYGEGDKFMGVTVPRTRQVAKQFKDCSLEVVDALMESEWHECRLCALLILREKYGKSADEVLNFYLSHTKGINNWDLVDLSAPYILGASLVDQKDRSILYTLAASESMWEQRIAIVSTLMLIRNNQFGDTIKLSEILMSSREDLIQKAIGWMLRETGKRDEGLLLSFLDTYSRKMPRTMLRYAIERLSSQLRKAYM